MLAGSGTALTAGRHYVWWDTSISSQLSALKYYLEDVDLNGKRTMHGPVEVKPSAISDQQSALKHGQAKFLSELGVRLEEKYQDYWKAQELRERLSQRSMKRTTSSQSFEQTSKAFEQPKELKETTSIKIEKTSEQDGEKQRSLASMQAIKISVKE